MLNRNHRALWHPAHHKLQLLNSAFDWLQKCGRSRIDQYFMQFSSTFRFFISMSAFLFGLTAALAENGGYKLQAGDTIEISVAGVSEMRQRFTLDLDGQISVPLVGVIKAEGLTISQLRDSLQHSLPAKAFRTSGADGQDIQRVIDAPDIAVNIVEYSPVYINGDVAKPGQQQFRPNLTVSQAIALAGGLEVMRYHLVDPVIASDDLGAEYQTLWMEQVREQARLARLKAQLNDDKALSGGVTAAPVSSQLQTDLLSNETEQLGLWHADYDKEVAFLTRAIKSASDQLSELTEQLAKEKEGTTTDEAELQRLTTFNKQGDVTSNRVVDARRAMLLSSTRVLQTEEQIIQITREKEGYVRRIDKLKDEMRSATLKDLEESQLRLAALNAKIATTADKMVYTSTMRSQLPLSKLGGPTIAIIRGNRDNRTRIDATEDTVLAPGDVVEISVVPKTKVTEN